MLFRSSLLGLRDGRFKFIHTLETSRSQLFDLDADPEEKRNLSEEDAGRAHRYAADLRQWSAAQKHLLSTFSR